jgi:cytochrome P450
VRRESPHNLLEAMITAADQPDSGIDDSQVAGNVLTMLLAGEDTTANTIAWMIHLLWANPLALALATEEVRRVCGTTEVPTLEMVEQLDVVEACCHETMRLKPVAPLLPQQALRPTTVGGVQIDAGMVVMGLMRVDSVSDAHIPNAAQFDPQRWLGGEGKPGQVASAAKRISMPFGAGPRICPGRYLAVSAQPTHVDSRPPDRFGVQLAGDQRCGSSCLIWLARCVGSRCRTSLR